MNSKRQTRLADDFLCFLRIMPEQLNFIDCFSQSDLVKSRPMNTLKLKSFFLQHRLFCQLACLTSLLFFSLSACYSSIQPDESRLSQTLAVTNPAEQAGQTAVAGPARSQPASSSTGRSAPSGIIAATASCLSPTKEENDQVDIQSATVCWPSESVSGTCAPTSAPTSTSLPAKTSQTTSSAALTVTKAESPPSTSCPSTSSPATSSPNKIQLESDPGQEMFLAANALRQKNGLAPFKKASAP